MFSIALTCFPDGRLVLRLLLVTSISLYSLKIDFAGSNKLIYIILMIRNFCLAFEPRHKKTNNLHMGKQRRRSAVQ